MTYPTTYAEHVASTAYNLTIRDGGGTFDPKTGRTANLTSGYAVGGAVESVTVLAYDLEWFRVQFSAFSAYARDYGAWEGHAYVGTWRHTDAYGRDVITLDVTTVEQDEAPAAWLARFRREEAIYDIANRKVITVR